MTITNLRAFAKVLVEKLGRPVTQAEYDNAFLGEVREVREKEMSIFTATFSAVAVSAAQDVFELVAASPNKVSLREVRIGQYSDFGDAAAEMLSVQIVVGHTTSGSGGSTVTGNNLRNWDTNAAPADTTTVEANNTTIASSGTGLVLIADSFNIASGWWYRPPEDERIMIDGAGSATARLVVRVTAPADAITTNGTIVYEENPSR